MIYVECKPDQKLVQLASGFQQREIIHELKGKYGIAARLGDQRNASGMLDEDPGKHQPSYLTKLHVSDEIIDAGLKLLKDTARGNQVILLMPRLEEWVLRAAHDVDLDVIRLGLPRNPNRLHEEINLDIRKFERLLRELESNNSFRLKALGNLIRAANP